MSENTPSAGASAAPPPQPGNETPLSTASEATAQVQGATVPAASDAPAVTAKAESKVESNKEVEAAAMKKSVAEQQAAPKPAPSVAAPSAPFSPSPAPGRSAGLWVGLLALLVGGVAVAIAALLWQKLSQTQQELARRSQDTSDLVALARTSASQAEALTQELQARLTVAEVRLSEVSLQRSQLEELMLTLSRSRDDNLVQDLESALRLGYQQSQLTGSAQPLVSALQAADQRISRAAQPRLNPVQRAIARDIERIQGASLADIPALVQRIDELSRQVDQWPVINQVDRVAVAKTAPARNTVPAPLVTDAAPSAGPVGAAPADTATAAVTATASVTAAPVEVASPSANNADAAAAANSAGDGLGRGWARISAWWNRVWTMAWNEMTQSGRELVRVSRIDRPEAALLAPEQAFFLRENLKLQLLNARLGLLARQNASARSDLAAAESAVGRYFSPSSKQVLAAQGELRQLATDLVGNELPRPDETLAALTAAAGGR